MYDRILAGTLVVLSGLIIWSALQFDVPFQYEPLGPKAFPIIVAALLAVTSLWLIIKPSAPKWHPSGRVSANIAGALVLLTIYAAMYEPMGFIVATFVVGTAFSMLFGERPLSAALYSLAISVVGYYLLKHALELNVPAGMLFGG